MKKRNSPDKRPILDTLYKDLEYLESYIEDIFTFLPVSICIVSPLGAILETNPAFEELSEAKIQETIGQPIWNFFEREKIEELAKETFKKGSVKNKELSFLTKTKKELIVSVYTRTRETKEKEISGYFLSFLDITSVKEAEKQLQEKVEALEQFHKLAVGRELRMVELKKEIKELKEGTKAKDEQ